MISFDHAISIITTKITFLSHFEYNQLHKIIMSTHQRVTTILHIKDFNSTFFFLETFFGDPRERSKDISFSKVSFDYFVPVFVLAYIVIKRASTCVWTLPPFPLLTP